MHCPDHCPPVALPLVTQMIRVNTRLCDPQLLYPASRNRGSKNKSQNGPVIMMFHNFSSLSFACRDRLRAEEIRIIWLCNFSYKSTFSGCSEAGAAPSVAAKKTSQSEAKSHEILLGNNLSGHEPPGPRGQQTRFSTLQRGASSGTAEGAAAAAARRERMKPNTDKWHFSTLPRKQ